RYYYNKRILHKTKGKRFTYKFNFSKLVMPNYPFINIRPSGEPEFGNAGMPGIRERREYGNAGIPGGSAAGKRPGSGSRPGGDRGRSGHREPRDLRDESGGILLAPSHPGAAAAQKRKPDAVLPLFPRPGMFPEHPHSPFAASPLPARPGVLNVPASPALSLTPTLFSYSPSPGLSPFAGSSCFSFNPEEMKRYLHSQACSVFNYHLSPRTFPRFPLAAPPLQRPLLLEEQPPFPIKLQPPPAGRKHRERMGSPEAAAAAAAAAAPRVKAEPDEEEEEEEAAEKRDEVGEEEEKLPVFARPAAPAWIPTPGEEAAAEGGAEKPPRDSCGDAGAQEKREDALMPPKLRLKRRWNGDSRQEIPE
ncbi:ETV3 protein, partial [Gymnorhina tibicen]|nr:ETV3 protein [Gymnorhina tibicen]